MSGEGILTDREKHWKKQYESERVNLVRSPASTRWGRVKAFLRTHWYRLPLIAAIAFVVGKVFWLGGIGAATVIGGCILAGWELQTMVRGGAMKRLERSVEFLRQSWNASALEAEDHRGRAGRLEKALRDVTDHGAMPLDLRERVRAALKGEEGRS